ncbi:MAG: hypothetical protein EBS41_00430 [Actinobacteria bacterium]|nr:hypothetical protein [Actinomycetota bacterium]
MQFLQYEPAGANGQRTNKAQYRGMRYEIPGIFLPDGTLDQDANLGNLFDRVAGTYAQTQRMSIVGPIYQRNSGLQDQVFVDGQIVREDASLFYPQAQDYLATLVDAFPNSFVDYDGSVFNVLGAYDAYREPYQNPSISWYQFTLPPAAVIERYQIADDLAAYGTKVLPWFGLKHDLVTKAILMKLVVQDVAFAKPDLPAGDRFYAVTYDEAGAINPLVDAYIITTADFMRDYCDRHGLLFPVNDAMAEMITMWGVVFNADTLALTTVKAYYEYGETPTF